MSRSVTMSHSDRLCANPWYLWAVFRDQANIENAMKPWQRKDDQMWVMYWTEYIKQGCPKGFQWPIK